MQLSLSPFSTLRFLIPFSSKLSQLRPLFHIAAMPPHGPNSKGGRRGGGFSSGRGGARGGGGGGRGGGGGGGRGEQRWWDPVWRAERLRQQQAEMEVFDENEWWNKIEQWKTGGEQEMLIKRNFSRGDQQTLSDMAYQLGLYFHAYNKGKTLVVSKVPLPDYRADLDERHGSTQKEIIMSTETEKKLGTLLKTTQESGSSNASTSAFSDQQDRTVTLGLKRPESTSKLLDSLEKESFSVALKERQEKLKGTESVKALQAFREKLPAFKMKEGFLNSVSENQVLVVSGETGCGKTTQLPQFILEEEIASLRGADCNIICTQPRRISAISVASRISAERGESIGESVGYQIRLESKRSDQTRLLFCTTGVLLRRLIEDPNLTNVSHLLVDEIHERGMNEDFLLIILRDLLPRRPDLRLILMSATINADMFSTYFGNAPTIHIPGFTFPVAELFLEDVLEKSRYSIKSSDSGNYQGSSRGRRRDSESKKDDLTTVFEDVDINFHYKSYSSATRRSLEAWSGAQIDLDLVEATIEHICRREGDGAILVFLTGWDEISKLLEKMNGNILLGDSSKFLILPLHGSMPTVNQREIFDRPPPNKRKIVLATNIAESSITIDDVVYVVDCGKAKETSYDALNKVACLLPSWISKASAHQRRGRAGRVQAGVCYRLYPKVIYDAFPQYQLPEIIRTPLQELCLHIKSLQVGSIGSFLAKALQPPDALAVENAIELL
ncbi:DExH-box ATP-dependent RNA helicase DExH1 [Cardamine amara subsp. amara]|uniref:RNA helicase n=1 Tax=Cardamine amara subsp. amara TaxID=228776 RepID=A0ABD1AWN5_CARAN